MPSDFRGEEDEKGRITRKVGVSVVEWYISAKTPTRCPTAIVNGTSRVGKVEC